MFSSSILITFKSFFSLLLEMLFGGFPPVLSLSSLATSTPPPLSNKSPDPSGGARSPQCFRRGAVDPVWLWDYVTDHRVWPARAVALIAGGTGGRGAVVRLLVNLVSVPMACVFIAVVVIVFVFGRFLLGFFFAPVSASFYFAVEVVR